MQARSPGDTAFGSSDEKDIVPMRMFAIEAYGGPHTTDGPIVRFTVHAGNLAEAIDLICRSPQGHRFGRFEVVDESAEFEADVAEIIGESPGPFEQML